MSIENYLKKIKDYWVLISVGSFALMIALLVGGYSSVFSGDIGASIEYVQAYISSMGITKIAVILVVFMLSFTVLFFMLAYASRWWFEEKWQGKSIPKIILWAGVVYAICILDTLFTVSIFTFLSGGYSAASSTAIYFYIYFFIATIALVTFFILVVPILRWPGIRVERIRRSWITRFFVIIMIIVPLWQPENILSVINSGNDEGYMVCLSGNRNINGKSEFFEKTVIPVSYDSRGVQVFSGNYDKETKKWSNIRRGYIYFDQGYEVKLGETCPERAEGK
ncbi:hypothetical protein HMPREF1324_1033 [Rothia aeria F0474]|jgi:putative NADH-ubiquinone oxidoreductase chain 2|uniref:Uncharacterized protein n=1 Tax=Rothia aeria F0474 TaxID=1125724 RepID=I0UR79_9MICC|nr:hypothetical protein [Rothia aeria]EID50382.1 hypothetical protein HMPREF1324_1033 [Rothia aeria F0474]